jgi:hypothetical protein
MRSDINSGLLVLHGNRSDALSTWSSGSDVLAPSDAQGMRGLHGAGAPQIVQQMAAQGAA